jgi:hypothetical protein
MAFGCSYLSRAIRSADLFSHNTLLRYNGDSNYNTVTGGVCSIAIIIIFVLLFFSMGLKIVQR